MKNYEINGKSYKIGYRKVDATFFDVYSKDAGGLITQRAENAKDYGYFFGKAEPNGEIENLAGWPSNYMARFESDDGESLWIGIEKA